MTAKELHKQKMAAKKAHRHGAAARLAEERERFAAQIQQRRRDAEEMEKRLKDEQRIPIAGQPRPRPSRLFAQSQMLSASLAIAAMGGMISSRGK
jgi:hypothetical protein